MKKRIKGIDVARALAVIGMVIVNFKIVFGSEGNAFLQQFTSVFEGKAAALFVVLAGVGISLMSKSALENLQLTKINVIRWSLFKRAIFLFVIGLSYTWIWEADILHFYGIYMLLTILLLRSDSEGILWSAAALIFIYPVLMMSVDYETGWNFSNLTYLDFWTPEGFVRNLFYNGFHPVVPWAAFMLIGFWFGKKDLQDRTVVTNSLWQSLAVFVTIQFISLGLSYAFYGDNEAMNESLKYIFGTSPMPPLPIYMISGSALSVAIICICILIVRRFEESWWVDALYKTGQLALTFYVAHVILGMGLALDESRVGEYSISFSFWYAIGFSFGCIIFAVLWRRRFRLGPLEWVMRKITS